MFNLWRIPACELSPPSFDRLGKFILEKLDLPEGTLQVVEWDCNSAFPTVQRRERVRPSKIVLPYPIPSRFQIRLEQGVRNSPWGIHRSWGRKARTFSRGRSLAPGGGGRTGQLASNLRWGGCLEENPERRVGAGAQGGEKRWSCRREIKRPPRLWEAGRSALTERRGGPCKLLSPALGPLLSASAFGSRSGPPAPRPAEVTPTALIIFCFAPGLFSATNFQQSPWQRTGEGGGRGYGNPRAGRRGGPGKLFRVSESRRPGRRARPRGVACGAPWAGPRAGSRR